MLANRGVLRLAHQRALAGGLQRSPGIIDECTTFSGNVWIERDGGPAASTSGACSTNSAAERSRSTQLAPFTFAAAGLATSATDAAASAATASPRRSRSGVANARAPAAGQDAAPPQLDVEELLGRALVQPMPLGSVRNNALGDAVVNIDGTYFFDPAKTLASTMRALNVVQEVLQGDGHILVLNSNPAMKPLLREAAYLNLNPNVWFWTDDWLPGVLSDASKAGMLFDPRKHQPSRELFAAQGVALRNAHCARPPALTKPKPSLAAADKQWLLAQLRAPGRSVSPLEKARYRRLLQPLLELETACARLPLPGSPPSARQGALALLVCLDLTYGAAAVREAAERNIMTASLLNPHSDLSDVTFPVYASDFHTGFQHFFLDWLLRIANLPSPQPAPRHGAQSTGAAPGAAAAAAAAGRQGA